MTGNHYPAGTPRPTVRAYAIVPAALAGVWAVAVLPAVWVAGLAGAALLPLYAAARTRTATRPIEETRP